MQWIAGGSPGQPTKACSGFPTDSTRALDYSSKCLERSGARFLLSSCFTNEGPEVPRPARTVLLKESVELIAFAGVLVVSLALAVASAAGFLASVVYFISLLARVHERAVALESGSGAAALLASDLAT